MFTNLAIDRGHHLVEHLGLVLKIQKGCSQASAVRSANHRDSHIPTQYTSLVGGAITILKNMKVNGKDYPIYYGK